MFVYIFKRINMEKKKKKKVIVYSRQGDQKTLVDFLLFFAKETNFVTSCLLSCTLRSFCKGFYIFHVYQVPSAKGSTFFMYPKFLLQRVLLFSCIPSSFCKGFYFLHVYQVPSAKGSTFFMYTKFLLQRVLHFSCIPSSFCKGFYFFHVYQVPSAKGSIFFMYTLLQRVLL